MLGRYFRRKLVIEWLNVNVGQYRFVQSIPLLTENPETNYGAQCFQILTPKVVALPFQPPPHKNLFGFQRPNLAPPLLQPLRVDQFVWSKLFANNLRLPHNSVVRFEANQLVPAE